MRFSGKSSGQSERKTPATRQPTVVLARREPGRENPVLRLQRTAGNAATVTLLSPVQRQPKKAKKVRVGVAKYGTTRLTERLQDMMQRGVLDVGGAPSTLTREQLFILQGVANVETGGKDNAVYTKDNMFVSLGFKQVTLNWGTLYDIIQAVPAAFAKHGIVLGGGTYRLKAGTRPAVEGAPDPAMLKTPPWTDRFFDAGSEDAVVSAMVAFTLKELSRMERRIATDNRGRSNSWMKDPTARAWLLETMNNRPANAWTAARKTLARTSGQQLTREAFLAVLESEIRGAYAAHDEGHKAANIIAKIPRAGGAATTPTGTPTPLPAPKPAASSTPPKGAGVDLVDQATKVLPPAAARSAGAGPAALAAIAALGLTGPAVRLLATLGHRDANALTNLAFWAAHPDLFGTKLVSSQPGFPALAAEWIQLRDGPVAAALKAAAPSAPSTAPAGPAAAPATTAPATADTGDSGTGDGRTAHG